MDSDNSIKPASQEEILFLRHKAPRGMWKMVEVRTGLTRQQVLYQIMQMPENQNLDVIQAAREILKAITGDEFGK
jgi:hypothetical protein